jgi:cytochrome c553
VLLELRGFLRDAFRRPRHEKVPLTKTRSKASMTCPTTLIARAALGLAVVAAHAAAQAPAFSGDPQKGAQKVAMCQGCHGIPGWRTAFPEVYQVPKIAGQHPAYLVKALQDYKSGARVHPSMRAIAASLSDDDMNNIAAYYAQSGLAVAP